MIAGIVVLSSCAQEAFREDFKGFNTAYADMLNEQMLLNLARLDNGHPAQFLAIGSIDSRFTFTGTAAGGFNGSNNNSTVVSGTGPVKGLFMLAGKALSTTLAVLTGESASLTGGVTSSPEFQWIPLNNEAVAKQVLQPMDPDVFYSLYQQGFPVDQLLRVMVERIETTLPGEGDVALVNSPTAGSLNSYGRFLRACAILRELQRSGALVIESSKEYQPVAQFTRSPQGAQKPAAGANNPGPNAANVPLDPVEDFQPTPEQVLAAEKDGYVWRKVREGVWELGKYEQIPKFYLKEKETKLITDKIEANKKFDKQAIQNVVTLLKDGFTVQSTVRDHSSSKTCLILRSFSRALEATAMEQEGFNDLEKQAIFGEFKDLVPAMELRPILQTYWDGRKVELLRPLVKLNYAGKTYQITDEVRPDTQVQGTSLETAFMDNSATWNRDVYRLIIALNSQVTVDISKFQRQILELQQ